MLGAMCVKDNKLILSMGSEEVREVVDHPKYIFDPLTLHPAIVSYTSSGSSTRQSAFAFAALTQLFPFLFEMSLRTRTVPLLVFLF